MANRILIRGHLDPAGGYGQLTIMLFHGLVARGYDVRIDPLAIDESAFRIPDDVRERVERRSRAPAQLLVWLPERDIGHNVKRTVHFTMWEACRMPQKFVNVLGMASGVVVPSAWNASCFVAQGLERPISIVPLPVDAALFWPMPHAPTEQIVFGTAGRNLKGVFRKRMDWVMDAFSKAFTRGENVKLKVKCWPGCIVPDSDDPRVEITRECLTPNAMADWFRSLSVYVTACAAGGWEMMPHQAMACGRPVIGPRFGGMAEYFDDRSGWELDFQLGRTDGHYAGGGRWADVSRDSLINAMRDAYQHGDLDWIGRRAAVRAQSFNIDRTLNALVPVLEKHQILY